MVYSISWHKTTNDAVERSGLTAIALLAPPHPQKKVSPPLAHRHGRTGDVSMFYTVFLWTILRRGRILSTIATPFVFIAIEYEPAYILPKRKQGHRQNPVSNSATIGFEEAGDSESRRCEKTPSCVGLRPTCMVFFIEIGSSDPLGLFESVLRELWHMVLQVNPCSFSK